MKRIGAFIASAASALTFAQQRVPVPHAGYVYPAGGQQGTTVTVTVGGQFLQGATAATFSGKGVTATPGEYVRALTQGQAKDLGDKIKEAQKKLGTGRRSMAAVLKEAGISQQDAKALQRFRANRTDPKRQLNPQLAETLELNVKVDANAEPGMHELRLLTAFGLTNAIRFFVARTPEVSELEPNDTAPQEISQRQVINGQIMPGDIDRYEFTGRKGARVHVAVSTRDIVPYLADAVPGFFQASVALTSASGKEVAYSDHVEFDQQPEFTCTLPADGRYTLSIRDSLFRGREDFIYRMSLDGSPMKTSGGSQSGCITRAGQVDTYAYKGHAGEKFVAEVTGRRIGSPIDACLEVLDDKGNRVAFNDDAPDAGAATLTHQADPYLACALPKNGAYTVKVRDTQDKFGSDYRYALRLGPPKPDFELRITPSSVNLRSGMPTPVTVYAIRRDGFAGEIRLEPAQGSGVTLSGGRIPAGSDSVRMTLAATGDPGTVRSISIEGSANIGGKTVRHAAQPADDMMQAFAYHHLVPAKELQIAVLGRPGRAFAWSAPKEIVSLQPGGTVDVFVGGPLGPIRNQLSLELSDAPAGITIRSVAPAIGGLRITLAADSKAKLSEGNLLMEAFLQQQGQNGKPRKVAVGFLPALPIRVTR